MSLTNHQRHRLGKHFENRLKEIGVDWNPGGQYAGPVLILEQFEWPPVPTAPHGEVDGLVDVREVLNKDGTYRMEFRGFYLLFREGITYSEMFRVAIHEGAHVMQWYERMKTTNNRFTKGDLENFSGSNHGAEFERWDSCLLSKASKSGSGDSEPIPKEVADLFKS
jgi:hypothetical protein